MRAPVVENVAPPENAVACTRAWVWFGGLMLACGGAAALITLGQGNVWLVPAVCAAAAFAVILVRHLAIGIYLLLGAALALDQFQVVGVSSAYIGQAIKFYLNLNTLTGIGALVFNPVELIMLLMAGIWFLRAAISRQWHLLRVPNSAVAMLFLGMLVFFTLFGLLRANSNWKAALWEIRPLYYLCCMYFLTTQIIRTPRQVRTCVWIIVGGLAWRGLQGCWIYFVTLGRNLGNLRAILGHEDSLFFITGFILLAAFFFLRYRGRERTVLAWAALPNFFAFILNQRRVTFGVLAFGLALLTVMLPRQGKLLAFKLFIPLAVLFVIYTAVFWNAHGVKAMPAQKIKSILVHQEGTDDDSSNEWRKLEMINLQATIRAYPLGIGFGQKYLVVIPYADIGEHFPLWQYIPHCAIFWIWIKTGFVGFVIFWLFFGVAIMQAMIDFRAIRDPYNKAIALTAMMFIAGQLIVAYYDLQITYYRNMIYLGVVMALGVTVRRLDGQQPRDGEAGEAHGG
jgi:hypothetical protein